MTEPPTDARTAPEAIHRARTRLLAGRGPGASDEEVRRHTRARSYVGGRATPEERAAVARQADRARRDTGA